MSKKSKIRAKLVSASDTPSIYRISRRSRKMDRIDGFVVGRGKRWVLVARTMDGGYSDGLVAVRVRDISTLERDRTFETAFAETQLQHAKVELASVDLDGTASLLDSMSSLSRLIGVEREKVQPGSLCVGQYEGHTGKWFGLSEVQSNATWRPQPFAYRLKEVTAVSIGSHYLTALAVIAPEAPTKIG